jgi:hypothetical protein
MQMFEITRLGNRIQKLLRRPNTNIAVWFTSELKARSLSKFVAAYSPQAEVAEVSSHNPFTLHCKNKSSLFVFSKDRLGLYPELLPADYVFICEDITAPLLMTARQQILEAGDGRLEVLA